MARKCSTALGFAIIGTGCATAQIVNPGNGSGSPPTTDAGALTSGTLAPARVATSVVNFTTAAYGVVPDCKEAPVADANGVYLYSGKTGTCTDNAAAMANLVSAAGVIGANAPIGANGEAEAGTTFQAAINFQSAQSGSSAQNAIYVSTMPYIPDGVTINMNGGTLLVGGASSNGIVFRNNNSGNTPGTVHDRLTNGRIVFVGSAGTSTGMGVGLLYGKNSLVRDVGIFGFNVGLMVAGTEYSTFDNVEAAHNNIGLACVPANFAAPAAITADGTPSINNYVTHGNFRNNLVGMALNGCNTSTFKDGTISFNRNAAVVLGALDFTYIDTFAVTGGSGCPANSTIAVTVAGANTLPARGVFITGTGGAITGAFSIDGGKGYSTSTAPTASIPGGTCTTNPTITPHVAAMTGMLPFAGVATTGVRQNVFEDFSIENEGVIGRVAGATARPLMGHQIVSDTSASQNIVSRIVSGLGGDDARFYAHFMRDEGYQNTISNLLPSVLTDPLTGATCPTIQTQASAFVGGYLLQNPTNSVCTAAGVTDTSANHAIQGWYGNLFSSRGFDTFGGAGDTSAQSRVTGEANARWQRFMDGSQNYYTPGTTTTDVNVGRVGTAFAGRATLGGIWGVTKGYNNNLPMATGVFGDQIEFTKSFVSFNASSTYPTPATTGIPSGMNCSAIFTWTGSGTGADGSAQYTSKALCNDGYNPAVMYQSQFHTLGTESYALDSLKVSQIQVAQVVGNSGAPSVTAGAAAGTSPGTPTVSGTNLSGTVTVIAGTATTTGTLATITFNGTLATAPQGCQLTSRTAATAPTATAIYTTAPTTTSFTIGASAALTASGTYVWGYICL